MILHPTRIRVRSLEPITQETYQYMNSFTFKNMVRDQDLFMRLSFQVLNQEKKFIHEYDLLDGRRFRRVSLPLFRDGELVGRNILLYDITVDKGS